MSSRKPSIVGRVNGAFALLVVLVGTAPDLAHADRIWRYVDSSGHVVYSNQPPKTGQGKATVIDTPHYAPPARWTGPSWAQVFGDGARRSPPATTDLPAAAGLPSPAFHTAGNGPLPPGFRLPPTSAVQPLPPLPGTVSPPVQMPWPTVTLPTATAQPASGVQASTPASSPTTGAPSSSSNAPVHPPAGPHEASAPVRAPVPASSPKVPSHPASAPAAAHTDHPT